jgi:hypothetical protein
MFLNQAKEINRQFADSCATTRKQQIVPLFSGVPPGRHHQPKTIQHGHAIFSSGLHAIIRLELHYTLLSSRL